MTSNGSYLLKLILLAASISTAWAGLPPTTMKGQLDASAKTKFGFQVPFQQSTDLGGISGLFETGNSNILKNPGFEDTSASAGWTASGGATATANTTAVGTGVKGYDWDSNSASQTLTSTAVAIPSGLLGQNAVAYCSIKTPSGTATHLLQAYDGTNIIGSTTITSSANFARTTLNFVMPGSGSISLRLISVASNEPEIYIDDCYLGAANNISNVSQASFYGGVIWPGTTSCTWSRTSNASFADFSATAACTFPSGSNLLGNGLAPATKIPAIKFTNMPPGEYYVVAYGDITSQTSGQACSYRFSDGTNGTSPVAVFVSSANGTSNPIMGRFSYTTTADRTISLQGTGSTGNQQCDVFASVANTINLEIDVYRYPSTSELAIRNPSQYFPNYSAKVAAAGTVSDESSDWLNGNCSVANTSEFTCSFNSGIFGTAPNCTATGLDTSTAAPIVKVFTQASTSSVVIKTYNNSATATAYAFNLNCQATTGASMPAPILVGSVTSNAAGAERIETAFFRGGSSSTNCTGSPCTIASQSGSWLSSVTRNSTGNYTLNIASGIFSAAPVCVCSSRIFGTGVGLCDAPGAQDTATSTSYNITTRDTSNTVQDSGVTINCMGPR